jgi:hypothetical protein
MATIQKLVYVGGANGENGGLMERNLLTAFVQCVSVAMLPWRELMQCNMIAEASVAPRTMV